MPARAFDPTRLDVAAFAAEAGALEGHWPLLGFARIVESAAAERPPSDADTVAWQARGERIGARGAAPETWLHLGAQTKVALQCQRCLAPVEVALALDRRLRFVAGEDAAAELDAESEDDVLALTRALDLRELIEDELLLAMPLVPLHEVCPEPLALPVDSAVADERPKPFAVLANWKRSGPLS